MSSLDSARLRLEQELPRLAGVHGVPGASIAVCAGGEQIEAVFGVVNRRTGVEVTPDSLFMIQSITKMLTATLVMQLVDEGAVDLDAPLQHYVPEFRTADADAAARVTVRHLLTHTGGFEGDLWVPTTTDDDALRRFVEDVVAQAPQYAAPGSLYSYCSAGFGVLGRLVEVMRGLPFPAAVRRHLTDPLGIREIAFNADEALLHRTAVGHYPRRPDGPAEPLDVWAVMPASNPAAGNQLAMSARDLLAFGRIHLAGGLATDGTRILSGSATHAMRHREIDEPTAAPGDDTAHGLGWWLSAGGDLIEHSGGTIGVSSRLRLAPDGQVGIAILTNGGGAGPLITELIDPLLHDLAGITPSPAPQLPADAIPAHPERYVGSYRTRVTSTEVTVDPTGRLSMTTASRNEAVVMTERAGLADPPDTAGLRPVADDVFMAVVDGRAAGTVAFVGSGEHQRAAYLHTGRASPRVPESASD